MYRSDESRVQGPPPARVSAPGTDGDRSLHDEWLSELLGSQQVAVCVLDLLQDSPRRDYRFLAVSPAFEQSTGLDNVVGRCMRELRPDHEEYWFELYQQVAETGEPVCFEHVAAALERRYRGHAFRLGGPGSHRVVVIFAVTLDTGEAGLEKFGATLAHELRSPLASMRNGLHVFKRLVPPTVEGERIVSMMDRQIARLSGLVDDMFDIGRLGSTAVGLKRETIDLHHVVTESVEACNAAIDANQHTVSIESDGAALQVRADARRMVQVFTNLLTNSIKYTAPRGHITFRLYAEGEWAVTEVSDDGVGIEKEDLAHVFDLFNQGAEHRAQASGGLGIGLSIVRSIVRLHGGSVAAHSDGKHKGSTFTVRLPLAS